MCIIVIKPAGADAASRINWLHNSWQHNKDGAGVMFAENGAVKFRKGFMDWPRLAEFVHANAAAWRKQTVAFHFRTATHGHVNAANCHPFPVTVKQGRLVRTAGYAQCAFMHNGILPDISSPHSADSDSLVFVRDFLAPFKEAAASGPVRRMLWALGGFNKFVLMTPTNVFAIGDFTKNEGWWFSNSDYMTLPLPVVQRHSPQAGYTGGAIARPRAQCLLCSCDIYREGQDICLRCDPDSWYNDAAKVPHALAATVKEGK